MLHPAVARLERERGVVIDGHDWPRGLGGHGGEECRHGGWGPARQETMSRLVSICARLRDADRREGKG